VARQHQIASVTSADGPAGFSVGSVILAWLAGFALGALALLAAAILLGKLEI